MKKLKEMLIDKNFYFCMIIALIFFGIFFKLEYATDTYTVFENSTKATVEHFFTSGRFVTAMCQMIVRGLHFSNILTYLLSFGLAIVSLSVALYKLSYILKEDIKNLWITILISVLVLINVFSIELFLYIEKGIMLFSVLLNVLAFEKLIEYFKGNRKSLIWIFVYMMIANFCYQGTVALFITLSLVYILKYSKNFKSFLKNNMVTAFCYGIPALINYLIVKFVFANNRIAGEFDFALSIQKILEGSKKMLLTYSIIPKYLFLAMIAIVLVVILYHIIKQNNSRKEKGLSVLMVGYIIIGIYMTTIFPQFMQATSSIWFVPRSSYAFGGILGILLVYLFMYYRVNVKLEKILIFGLIVFLLVQYINFQTIARDHYIVNYLDEYRANIIKEKIEEYEEKTKVPVTKIAFYQGEDLSWTYPGIKCIGDINIQAIYPDWSRISYLKHYLKRSFETVEESPEIYEEYFAQKEWKYFDDQQLIIKDDTLHMYLY